jgi:hypothetical protein
LNIWLYFEDKRTGQILTKVNRGEAISDLITSPLNSQRREIAENPDMHENLKDYLLNKDQRTALKRSMAKQTK